MLNSGRRLYSHVIGMVEDKYILFDNEVFPCGKQGKAVKFNIPHDVEYIRIVGTITKGKKTDRCCSECYIPTSPPPSGAKPPYSNIITFATIGLRPIGLPSPSPTPVISPTVTESPVEPISTKSELPSTELPGGGAPPPTPGEPSQEPGEVITKEREEISPPTVSVDPKTITVISGESASVTFTASGERPSGYVVKVDGIIHDQGVWDSPFSKAYGITTSKPGQHTIIGEFSNENGDTASATCTINITEIPTTYSPFLYVYLDGQQIFYKNEDGTYEVNFTSGMKFSGEHYISFSMRSDCSYTVSLTAYVPRPEVTEKTKPVIKNAKVSDITHNGAIVSWDTEQDTTGFRNYVAFSPHQADYKYQMEATGGTHHMAELAGLPSGSKIYLYVASENENGTTVFRLDPFETPIAPNAPHIYDVKTKPTSDGGVVEWKTDRDAKSWVEYGSGLIEDHVAQSSGTTEHRAVLTDMRADYPVYFRIYAQNEHGTNSSPRYWFRSLPEEVIPQIYDVHIENRTATGVDVVWKTDVDTIIGGDYVEYFEVLPQDVIEKLPPDDDRLKTYIVNAGYGTKHIARLRHLKGNTTYKYRCTSKTRTGARTTDWFEVTTGTGGARPPSISSVNISQSGEGVVIEWVTDIDTTGYMDGVRYGYDEKMMFAIPASQGTKHKAVIDYIEPDRTLYIRAFSLSAGGRTESETLTFKRPSPLSIKTHRVLDIGQNSFTVKWTTNIPANKNVLLYGTSKDNMSQVYATNDLTHIAVVKNLSPDTIYFYQMYSENDTDRCISRVYSLRTQPKPPEYAENPIIATVRSITDWVSNLIPVQ